MLSVRIRTIFVRIRTETFLFFSPQNSGKQGIPVKAMTQLMILDTPIRKIMMPVISALSRKILGSSENLMDL